MTCIDRLRRAPGWLVSAVSGLSPGQITWKPSPAEFSILENVAHMHDIEREGYLQRVRRILEEDHPRLPDIDGNRLAVERHYSLRDLGTELDGFAAARAGTLEILERVPAEGWLRQADLETVGVVTLERLVEMLVEHDRGHLDDIARVRLALPPSATSTARRQADKPAAP